MNRLSIVAPVHNEAQGILDFVIEVERVFATLSASHWICSLILVDDGSTDNSWSILQNYDSVSSLKLIRLSKNFGHQQAVWAGLSAVDDDSYCIVLDSDLQDPPGLIPEILERFESGFDTVLMKRASRKDGVLKRFFASMYYKIQSLLSGTSIEKNVADFFGLSPRARKSLLLHEESVKYIRGLVHHIGYQTTTISYARQARSKGKTHYTISKMFSLALAGITGFSVSPLILVVYFAVFGSLTAIVFSGYVLYLKFYSTASLQPGWAFLSVMTLSLSALILFSLAVISLYLARVVQEIKKRPLFLVEEQINKMEGSQ
jgi:glycosyltransferase involved in cell wall biosynthesis